MGRFSTLLSGKADLVGGIFTPCQRCAVAPPRRQLQHAVAHTACIWRNVVTGGGQIDRMQLANCGSRFRSHPRWMR